MTPGGEDDDAAAAKSLGWAPGATEMATRDAAAEEEGADAEAAKM